MKLTKTIAACGAALIALSACNQKDGKPLGDFDNATQADSVSYYLGAFQGLDLKNAALMDTTLRSEEAQKAFLEGFRKGMEMLTEDEAYNQGLANGVQFAVTLRDYGKLFDKELSPEMVTEGFAYALNDSTFNADEASLYLEQTRRQWESERETALKAECQEALAEYAKKNKMVALAPTLYKGVGQSGDGVQLADGLTVPLSFEITTAGGKELNIPTPSSVTVGQGILPGSPIDVAIRSMKENETAYFAAPAIEVIGANCESTAGVSPSEVVIVKIKAGQATAAKEAAPAREAAPAKPAR